MTNNRENYLELLQIDIDETPVIAVVGGGGKTSLIFRLTEELAAQGKKVIVTTTTHMAYEKDRPLNVGLDEAGIRNNLDAYGYTIVAEWKPGDPKISRLSEDDLMKLKDLCDAVLIEADGAKGLSIKVPESWEPVIPKMADLVISVIGLDCLGKPIRRTAYRMERTARFLEKSLDAPITEGDVIRIASSICGLFKNVEDRVYRVYLNKADTLPDGRAVREIVTALQEKKQVAAYGSLKEGDGQDDGEDCIDHACGGEQ